MDLKLDSIFYTSIVLNLRTVLFCSAFILAAATRSGKSTDCVDFGSGGLRYYLNEMQTGLAARLLCDQLANPIVIAQSWAEGAVGCLQRQRQAAQPSRCALSPCCGPLVLE